MLSLVCIQTNHLLSNHNSCSSKPRTYSSENVNRASTGNSSMNIFITIGNSVLQLWTFTSGGVPFICVKAKKKDWVVFCFVELSATGVNKMCRQLMRCSSWMVLCNYYNSHWNFNGKLLKTNFIKSMRHLLSRNIRIKLHRTIILAYVVYGCKSPCLSLRQEYGLMLCKNWVLGGMFQPKNV
jgi:hypothetical protein